MDLEMTGLDPERHVIVEIATIVTDDDLAVVAEGPDLVISATPDQLAMMDDVVRKMHTSSGLLGAIEASTTTLEEAGAATLAFLREKVPEAGTVPLCGNSIGMDRRFLRQYLPELDDHFHYRSLDVSTLKELCKRWYRDVYASRPQKLTAHRALDDIRESVAELAYYRDRLFRSAAEIEAASGPGSTTASVAPTHTSGTGAVSRTGEVPG